MKSIVILPGDTGYNLGDIAILQATIQMVKARLPDCGISVYGKKPYLPGGFEDVRFIRRVGPAAIRAIVRADLLVWGGGQLLQGNRSRIKIPYWLFIVAALRLLRKNVMGFAQGIGPLPRRVDKWLVREAGRCTSLFTVRDRESHELLLDAGVPGEKVHLTSDPALLLATRRSNVTHGATVRTHSPKIALSLRYTGHHKEGRIVPFQFLPARLRRKVFESDDFLGFLEAMAHLCNRLIEELQAEILLFPFYHAPWESDEIIVERLPQMVRRPEMVTIYRPGENVIEALDAMEQMDVFVGTPMHSTILATSVCVPTLALYYESKGREFFKMIGQEEWATPLEQAWSEAESDSLFEHIRDLWKVRHTVRKTLERRIPEIQAKAASNADHLVALLEK